MKEEIPQIEKGIPLIRRNIRTGKWVQLAEKMEKGDSVLLPNLSVAAALITTLKRQKKKGTCRKITNSLTGENGYRVWVV